MGQKQTTTQRADPWEPAQGPLRGILKQAGNLYRGGDFKVTPYKGDWVANQTAAQKMGMQGILGAVPGMAQAGQAGLDAVSRLAGPQSFDDLRQNVMEDVMPGLNSTFAGSGMTGSTLHQQNFAKGLGSAMAGARMQQQGQQLQAAGMLPEAMAGAVSPYQMAMGVGQQQQAQQQAEIDARMKKLLMGQTAKVGALKDYASLVSGIGSGFGSTTGTQSQNMGLGGILGLGLSLL